ncbi:unnamed protein product [Caenorhabditis bovis]|uniref:Uncharacterized protein n=1 Tax=Caenorhabditis bovis TaxID=2654633 RepID=A0A8S1EYY6_9PELO|nr:unnamed protein product [Caenorhabditis bovis]
MRAILITFVVIGLVYSIPNPDGSVNASYVAGGEVFDESLTNQTARLSRQIDAESQESAEHGSGIDSESLEDVGVEPRFKRGGGFGQSGCGGGGQQGGGGRQGQQQQGGGGGGGYGGRQQQQQNGGGGY